LKFDAAIAGNGSAGLAAEIDFGRRGLSAIIWERLGRSACKRPSTQPINNRSMERPRRWRMTDRPRTRNVIDPDINPGAIFATRLSGHLPHWLDQPFIGRNKITASPENTAMHERNNDNADDQPECGELTA
jgi:hypothetical protein